MPIPANKLWKEYEDSLGMDNHSKWNDFTPEEKKSCRTCCWILHTVDSEYTDDFWCVCKKLTRKKWFQPTEPDKPKCKLWLINHDFFVDWLVDPEARKEMLEESFSGSWR